MLESNPINVSTQDHLKYKMFLEHHIPSRLVSLFAHCRRSLRVLWEIPVTPRCYSVRTFILAYLEYPLKVKILGTFWPQVVASLAYLSASELIPRKRTESVYHCRGDVLRDR